MIFTRNRNRIKLAESDECSRALECTQFIGILLFFGFPLLFSLSFNLTEAAQHHHRPWEGSNPLAVSTQSASGRTEAEKVTEQDSAHSVPPPQAPPKPSSSQSPSSSRLINQFVKDLSEEVVAVKGILDKQIRSQVETIRQLAVGSKSKELKTQVQYNMMLMDR